MAMFWRGAVLLLFSVSSSLGGNPGVLSKTESRLHLFTGTTSSLPPPPSAAFQEHDAARKSVGLAAIYSLLLPGMGELYADGFSSGKYFLIAEGALWLTYATFEIYGNSLRDDARAFAISRAGVDPTNKTDQFFVDIGNYLNIDEYNQIKLQEREPHKVYDPAAGYYWSWESDAARAEYRSNRISSENMYNNRNFVVAAVLINHVASAINAARSAISHNNALDDVLGDLRISAKPMGGFRHPHGIIVSFRRTL